MSNATTIPTEHLTTEGTFADTRWEVWEAADCTDTWGYTLYHGSIEYQSPDLYMSAADARFFAFATIARQEADALAASDEACYCLSMADAIDYDALAEWDSLADACTEEAEQAALDAERR